MKNVRSLKLNKLSEQELSTRELNCLKGGENCCICNCGKNTAIDQGNYDNAHGNADTGGYGNGSFG